MWLVNTKWHEIRFFENFFRAPDEAGASHPVIFSAFIDTKWEKSNSQACVARNGSPCVVTGPETLE